MKACPQIRGLPGSTSKLIVAQCGYQILGGLNQNIYNEHFSHFNTFYQTNKGAKKIIQDKKIAQISDSLKSKTQNSISKQKVNGIDH